MKESFKKSDEKPGKKPGTFNVAKAVGTVTFLEIIRDKILYNILMCCFLLFGVGFLASRLTFIRPERVILDFGLSAVTFSCAMIAIFTGSSLLAKEFDRRTVYVALCHPISKAQFIFGKYVGLASVLFLNWFLLSISYLIILRCTDGGVQLLSRTLFFGIFLVLIQSLLISSLAILFSTFSTTSLAAIYSIGFYVIGSNISQVRLVAARIQSPARRAILEFVATILPNLEYFNFGLKVTYGLPVSLTLFCCSVLYGFFMVTLLLIIAGFLIQSREV